MNTVLIGEAESTERASAATATLYRMVMPNHLCPSGLKAKDLLERHGFAIDDHHLKTRAETDAFKAEHDVKTTPQVWIDGKRIGGYDALRAHFGNPVRGKDETSYQPVIAIFAICALLALAVSWYTFETIFTLRAFEWFIGFSMAVLAIQKLQNVEQFSTMFLTYDLLARRYVPYSRAYPFLEGGAAVLMVSGALVWLSAPIAVLIGTIGAASVFKAVYIDKRELKCACTGGGSNVPLGFVSLTENLMMMAMGIWMPVKIYLLGW
ncbi:MAG: glutaredoxin [Pseudomonadota bacterium]